MASSYFRRFNSNKPLRHRLCPHQQGPDFRSSSTLEDFTELSTQNVCTKKLCCGSIVFFYCTGICLYRQRKPKKTSVYTVRDVIKIQTGTSRIQVRNHTPQEATSAVNSIFVKLSAVELDNISLHFMETDV